MKTGLFWKLHRAVQACFWLLWLLVAGFLYTQRALFVPAVDLAELWWNQPRDQRGELGQLSGRVTKVYDGDSFQLRDDKGLLYNYGLAGVTVPKPGAKASRLERAAAGEALTNLTRVLVGEKVDLVVTLANPQNRTGLGLAQVGGTNLNAWVLTEGWGRLNRDQIRALPLVEQFGLVSAERAARRRGAGVWAGAPEARRDGE